MHKRSLSKAARWLGISIIIALPIGVLIRSLPLAPSPGEEPLRLVVTAVFPAGSANDLRDSELTVLRDALDGVPDITYIDFGATSAQEAEMMIVFNEGADLKSAVSDVQNRINAVQRKLPSLTKRGRPRVTETARGRLIFLDIHRMYSREGPEVFDNESLMQLSAALNQLRGVAGTMIVRGSLCVERLKLDRDRMRRWSISAERIADSMNPNTARLWWFQKTRETPQGIEYARMTGSLGRRPEEDGKVILKAMPDGAIVRFKDVGESEIGPLFYTWEGPEGPFSATIVLTTLLGASSDAVMEEVRRWLPKIKTKSLSADMSFDVSDNLPTVWQRQPIRAQPAHPRNQAGKRPESRRSE